MRRPGRRRSYRVLLFGLLAMLLAAAGGVYWAEARKEQVRKTVESLPTASVRRSDLWVSVTSAGLVESSNQTVVECELESLAVGVRGRAIAAGGASTILSLVPEGSQVKTGDVLCELDRSDYDELARQQEMNVARAKSDFALATLDLDIARMSVAEFREGIHKQTLKENESRIALAKWAWERAVTRLSWSNRMLAFRYTSVSQIMSDTLTERTTAFLFSQAKLNSVVYRKYTAGRTLREIKNAVIAAETIVEYQKQRLARHQERMDNIRRQIDRCTIRAPHDGFVIYANDPRRSFVIEPGIPVRQKQRLFFLPDLSQLEVKALLHETIVDRVRNDMRAKVRIEGLANRMLEGYVTSVAILPTRDFFSEVPYYLATIKIDSIPRGLLPGMSAEIEISTARRNDVLTIPAESLTIEDGQDVCYVADEDGLERRPVKLGQACRNELEVTEGLSEGEQVVLNPTSFGAAALCESDGPETISEVSPPTAEPETGLTEDTH